MEAASVNIESIENDEIDSFSDGGDAGCLSAASLGTDSHSSNGSINLLFSPVRRGSACRQLHPLPTILQTDLTNSDQFKTKKYYKKLSLTEEEVATNKELYEEIVGNEFPEEDMVDKAFRDKDKELALKSWILSVLEFGEAGERERDKESNKCKMKEKKLMETEELNFLLQSGIVLCKLAAIIVPGTEILVEQLQTGNLSTKKKNIHLFLKCAGNYGVPDKYLFKPDDLVVQAHFYKVTRAVFAFAEMTNTDPGYCGPEFDFDKIIKDLMNKGMRRKSSVQDTTLQSLHNINSIFANLMQDVERRNSITPKGPPTNIYACD